MPLASPTLVPVQRSLLGLGAQPCLGRAIGAPGNLEEGTMEKTGIPEGMGYLIIDVIAVVVLIAVLAWVTYKYRSYRKGRRDRPTD